MKYLSIMFFSVVCMAVDVPEHMKGAVIIVTAKDGNDYVYRGEEYAVVKRESMGKQKQSKPSAKAEFKRHKLRAYVGYGPNGLKASKSDDRYTITQKNTALVGLGYTYMLNPTYGVGVSAFSNNSNFVNLEVNF